MEKKFYLRNGEEVLLSEQLSNGKYLVEKMLCYCDYDGDETSEPSGEEIVVDKIYSKPPTEEIDSTIKKLECTKEDLSQKIIKLKDAIAVAKREKKKIEGSVLDFSALNNSNTLTLFIENKPTPITFESNDAQQTGKLKLEIGFYYGFKQSSIQQASIYYYDGKQIDMDIGILKDASAEDIEKAQIEITQRRVFLSYISQSELMRIPNKILPKKALLEKRSYMYSALCYRIRETKDTLKRKEQYSKEYLQEISEKKDKLKIYEEEMKKYDSDDNYEWNEDLLK